MVRLLLSYGADKGAKSGDGQTARSIALEKGCREIADLLQQ
jgi:ankyrin repeat protein